MHLVYTLDSYGSTGEAREGVVGRIFGLLTLVWHWTIVLLVVAMICSLKHVTVMSDV